jgi:hypothetical protein
MEEELEGTADAVILGLLGRRGLDILPAVESVRLDCEPSACEPV